MQVLLTLKGTACRSRWKGVHHAACQGGKSILWEPQCWGDSASTEQLIGIRRVPMLGDRGETEYDHVGAINVQP